MVLGGLVSRPPEPPLGLRGTMGFVVVVARVGGGEVAGERSMLASGGGGGTVTGAGKVGGGGGVGGGAGGGGGASKSSGGTPSRASVMKAFHVSAGIEPPVTRATPLMLNSDVGLFLSPIHTAVESAGV